MNHKFWVLIATIATLQTEGSFAKSKKDISAKNLLQSISSSYFLQTTLAEDDCKKFLGESCFFRDSLLQEPYFHQTNATIFLGKIFAKQHFHDKDILLKIKDGSYSIKTLQNNLVSFFIKNGEVFNLKLAQGNLAQERQEKSRCATSEMLYNFYDTYSQQDKLMIKSWHYKDEYNFDGINEYILFAENNAATEIMAIHKKPANTIFTALNSIRLCKFSNSEILSVRHVNEDECSTDNFAEECTKYANCEDVLALENCEVTLFKDGF